MDLGACLLRQGKFAEAEPLLRASLTAGERVRPEEWTTFHLRSLLGEALLGRKDPRDLLAQPDRPDRSVLQGLREQQVPPALLGGKDLRDL